MLGKLLFLVVLNTLIRSATVVNVVANQKPQAIVPSVGLKRYLRNRVIIGF